MGRAMVRVDDMVPATLEGEQDVLLSDGRFVLKTTDALEGVWRWIP